MDSINFSVRPCTKKSIHSVRMKLASSRCTGSCYTKQSSGYPAKSWPHTWLMLPVV